MGHHAWMDESERRQGPGEHTYLIGACICDQSEEEVREALAPLMPSEAPKLHWRDMSPKEKRWSIQTIQSFQLVHIVVALTPLIGKAERSRRKCMEVMLPILETRGVDELVLESRDKHQNQLDYKFIQAMRSRRFITKQFRANFASGPSDARLWLPDQALGAVGDQQQTGNQSYDEFSHSVEMHIISP